ncbi:hypothetical protein CHM34_10540 [Paludifilum halophilum]|uniref:Peptidase M14 domain-containing protein n=2 Tax=Paludifilum halophilum TaxID=1642702 RepID=A0A235B5H5_9BACL|nr:hypothetical protein CHM34_10540 [Paludifilum halophilum]
MVFSPVAVQAHHDGEEADRSLFNEKHYDFVKYSKFEETLKQLEQESRRVSVKVSGQSAGGHDMYVVTVAEPGSQKHFSKYRNMRKQMFKSEMKAESFTGKDVDFKVPILINGSIHGTEFAGSDAVLKLLERFATQNDPATKSILENNVLIFNVSANPDGRWSATRFNSEGFDLNRDFITQSQPETRQMVDLITRWNPMVLLDLHGYVKYSEENPGLMEPCTPPHNPNYEYDLFSKWSQDQAEAMEAEVVGNRDAYETDLYRNMKGTYIPQRDGEAGWDDYPPIFTPMYAMYHGAFAYTLEAPTNEWDGVRWQMDAVMGALKFATENKEGMIRDQLEMFRRGINFDHPHHKEGFFAKTYILPVDEDQPNATHQAVNHLIDNGIRVERAKDAFQAGGKRYPAGTFVVPMDQAKAGLANTMLWDGEDITEDTPNMYDISAWSLPELWGFQADPVDQFVEADSSPVKKKVKKHGSLEGKGPYQIPNQSVEAVNLVNHLLQKGIPVKRDQKGDFYVEAQKGSVLKKAVRRSGLTLHSSSVPERAHSLESLKVAILKDGGINKQQSHAGTRTALERLGFQVTELHPRTVAEEGLAPYDVFVYSGTSRMISTELSKANKEFGLEDADQYEAFQRNVNQFVDKGGKFIAVGSSASEATAKLDLTEVTVHHGGTNSNGIVHVENGDTELTAGYGDRDLGFVYRPGWYSDTGGATVAASYSDGDFFHSGHWKGKDQAEGQPVIVQEKEQDVTLIGLEPGFRGHTDYLYRYLSNAVFHKQ